MVPLVFVVGGFLILDNPPTMRIVPLILAIIAPISLGIAYIAEIFFGILAWLVLEHFRIRSLPVYAALGMLIGVLVFVAIAILEKDLLDHGATKFLRLDNPVLYVCAIAGALSSTLFHIILFFRVRRTRRAPRSTRQPPSRQA